jgi:cytochrome P450
MLTASTLAENPIPAGAAPGRRPSPRLPPGPKRWDLAALYGTVFNPEPAIVALMRQFGDPMTFRLFGPDLLITGHPDGVRDILTADPAHFAPFGGELFGAVIGQGSILLKSGEAHRADRRLLTPPFHGARMRAYGQIIQDVALRAAAAFPRGRPFDVLHRTQDISLEVILRAVFGIIEPERVARYRGTLKEVVAAMNPLILFFPALRKSLFGLGPWARFERVRQRIFAMLHDEIERRRDTPGEDILGLLLSSRHEDGSALAEEDVRDHLMTLLFAGHETTALGLSWALYRLLRTPGARDRLREELAPLGTTPSPEALAKLPYLEAVCHETLRLHPVVPLHASRVLQQPLSVRGYEVPAGMAVGASGVVLHQREDLYPEPQRFRPERFLERTYSPFEYIPFGGGNRRCIGSAFALYEMKIVLGTLLSSGRLELSPALASGPPPQTTRRTFSLGPKGRGNARPGRGVSRVPWGPGPAPPGPPGPRRRRVRHKSGWRHRGAPDRGERGRRACHLVTPRSGHRKFLHQISSRPAGTGRAEFARRRGNPGQRRTHSGAGVAPCEGPPFRGLSTERREKARCFPARFGRPSLSLQPGDRRRVRRGS